MECENFLNAAALHNFPVFHDRDAVADLRHNLQIMRPPRIRIESKKGYGGRSTGTSAVSQIADDNGAPPESSELGRCCRKRFFWQVN